MGMPQETRREVPGWVVTMSDMMTLLLTFFVLLVAMADTRTGALAGVGQGAFVKRVIQDGKPSIMPGSDSRNRGRYESDRWWVPSQTGDPDQLQHVYEQLLSEIQPRFQPNELSVAYERNGLSITLGSRIDFEDDHARLSPPVKLLLRQIADQLRIHPELTLRIQGYTPQGEAWNTDLFDSAQQGALVFAWLNRLGVDAQRMSLWGWGSSRPLVRTDPTSSANRALVLELIPEVVAVSATQQE